MDEMIKSWLVEMYDREIESAEGSIEQERCWANGAPDYATTAMHMDNMERFEEYIRTLESLKDEVKE